MEFCGCARAHISVNIYVRDQKAKCSEQILFCILPVRKLNTVLFRNTKGCWHKKAAADKGRERIIYRYTMMSREEGRVIVTSCFGSFLVSTTASDPKSLFPNT